MPTITRSGVRISTDARFKTYNDVMVNGEQTKITVGTLEPSTTYYAKGLAEANSELYISENYISFNTKPQVVKYLTFKAIDAGSTIEMEHHGTNETDTMPVIYWSRDLAEWERWDYAQITIENIGDCVYMFGENPHGISHSTDNFSNYAIGGEVSVNGDVTSLVDTEGVGDLTGLDYCFYKLFTGCAALTDTPELPAVVLSNHCYHSMFGECSGLTGAPTLPATTLADGCYASMFYSCTGLTTTPILPSKTLAENCYAFMFSGCSSITSATGISATDFPQHCCEYMFYNCTSLRSAPAISGTIMLNYACLNMFKGCTALTSASTVDFSTVGYGGCMAMFDGCESLVNAPTLPATSVGVFGYASMFHNCTSLVTAPELPATYIGTQGYEDMFYGCTALVNPPSVLPNPYASGSNERYYQMFKGCTSLRRSPRMEIKTFAFWDCKEMFYGCTSLTEVTCLAENAGNFDSHQATWTWMVDVAARGTFYKSPNETNWRNGGSGIPNGWTILDYEP